jgi:hypothetical protein
MAGPFLDLQEHVAVSIRSRKMQRQREAEESRRIALKNPLALEVPPNDENKYSSHSKKGMCEKLGASGQATLEEIRAMTSCLVLDVDKPRFDVFCRVNSGMGRSKSHVDLDVQDFHNMAILG